MDILRIYFLLFASLVAGTAAYAECEQHEKLGIPKNVDKILCRSGYVVGYGYKIKGARYVAARLTTESVHSNKVDRALPDAFKEDIEIPARYRTRLSDYKGSGYDRGHLIPSADVDFSRKANRETFILSNISPQLPGFNRDMAGYMGAWGALESRVRRWVSHYGEIYVFAGPIYSRKPKTIGRGVMVPDSFFKIIVAPKQGHTIAFILPHEENKRSRLKSYIVSIDNIEKVTGLDFLSKLRNDLETQIEAKPYAGMWTIMPSETPASLNEATSAIKDVFDAVTDGMKSIVPKM